MSLKSFHIIFLLLSSLLGIGFGYWCYIEWSLYNETIYLFYSLIGITLCISLGVYSKWFLKEISNLNVN
jgi:hypothetical protein